MKNVLVTNALAQFAPTLGFCRMSPDMETRVIVSKSLWLSSLFGTFSMLRQGVKEGGFLDRDVVPHSF